MARICIACMYWPAGQPERTCATVAHRGSVGLGEALRTLAQLGHLGAEVVAGHLQNLQGKRDEAECAGCVSWPLMETASLFDYLLQ